MPRVVEPCALRDAATAWTYEAIGAAAEVGGWATRRGCSSWTSRSPLRSCPGCCRPKLPMECVRGLGPDGRFEIGVGSPAEVWMFLFVTAARGGSYGQGKQGAYGRCAV